MWRMRCQPSKVSLRMDAVNGASNSRRSVGALNHNAVSIWVWIASVSISKLSFQLCGLANCQPNQSVSATCSGRGSKQVKMMEHQQMMERHR